MIPVIDRSWQANLAATSCLLTVSIDFLFLFLVDEPVLHQRPQRRKPVPPRDLLPFRVVPPLVRDRDLVHPRAALEELGRDLGLDAEPFAAQGQRLQAV